LLRDLQIHPALYFGFACEIDDTFAYVFERYGVLVIGVEFNVE